MSIRSFIRRLLYFAGIALVLIGVAGCYLTIIRGFKPEFLQFKVFTIYSQYIESKSFTTILNNQADELSVLLYWSGWVVISCAKSKTVLNSVAIYSVFNAVGYLLFHGVAILYFLFFSLFIAPLFFIIKFATYGRKSCNTADLE